MNREDARIRTRPVGPAPSPAAHETARALIEVCDGMLGGTCVLVPLRDARGRLTDYELREISPRFAGLIDAPVGAAVCRGSTVFTATPPPFLDHVDDLAHDGDTCEVDQLVPTLGKRIRLQLVRIRSDHVLVVGHEPTGEAQRGSEPHDPTIVAVINRILTSSMSCDDERALAEVCLRELERVTGSAFGWIGELNADGLLDTIAISDPGWADCMMPDGDRTRLTCNMELRGLWSEVIRTERPLLTNDPGGHPAAVGLPDGHPPLRSFLGVPIMREGRIFGMIALGNGPDGFRESDADLVAKITPTIAEVLHRKRLQDEVARHRNRLQDEVEARTAELSAAVAELEEQNRRFLSILDAHPAVVYLADPDTHELLWVNRYFRDLLGYDPSGKICHEEIQGLPEPCAFCTNDVIKMQPGVPHHWEYHNPMLGIDLEIVDILVPWTDGRMVRYEHAIDVSERKRTQRQLEAFIAHSIDGYWLSDRQGRILDVNPALCELLGHAREDLLEMAIDDLERPAPGAEPSETAATRIDGLIAETTGHFETRYRCADGRLIDVDVGATFLDLDGGRVQAFVHDITDRLAHERELEASVEALARSNAELEQFAYLASHDLREPLRKVQAFGGRLVAMLDDRLDDKSRDYLDRVVSSADRMQRLIDDLLSYSRITTRAQPVEPVDLAAVAERVCEDLELRIEETGARVDIGSLPTVMAEPVHMHVLFQNLIGNSLKFHREGVRPEVRVSAVSDPDAGTVTLTFTDNGIGFEPHYTDRIFRIFQRLHPRDEYEGTGIGLALCEKIVTRHGGRITADGRPGEGATFTVTLGPSTSPSEGTPS
ncbi:GAF domain-containing protein [bacterium]|nr:GAF domain-containing protein [bacterium]